MAERDYFIDKDMNGNRLANVAQPVNDQDAATKKYVDDSMAGVGGGVITEWRQFNIGTNSTLDHNESIVTVDALPGGYFMGEIQVRVIGSEINASKTDVVSLDLIQTSNPTVSLMPNEKPLFYDTMGLANQGNRYMRFFFRKLTTGPIDYFLAFQLADTLNNVILAGGKLNIYRIADPVSSWS